MKLFTVALLALSSGAFALPTDSTGSGTARLEERKGTPISINCMLLCFDPILRHEAACRSVCARNEHDQKEHLNEKQANDFISLVFPQYEFYLARMDSWGKKRAYMEDREPAYFDDHFYYYTGPPVRAKAE